MRALLYRSRTCESQAMLGADGWTRIVRREPCGSGGAPAMTLALALLRARRGMVLQPLEPLQFRRQLCCTPSSSEQHTQTCAGDFGKLASYNCRHGTASVGCTMILAISSAEMQTLLLHCEQSVETDPFIGSVGSLFLPSCFMLIFSLRQLQADHTHCA